MAEQDSNNPNTDPRPVGSVSINPPHSAQSAQKPAPPQVTNHFAPPIRGQDGLGVYALAHHLSHTEWKPAEELVRAQLRQARELIRFARRFVPFYKTYFDGVMDDPDEELSAERFAALPILTREALQHAGDAMFSPVIPNGHGRTFDVHTSGSSGHPVHARSTELSNMSNLAAALRGHQWFRRDLAGTNVSIKVLTEEQTRGKVQSWAIGSTGRGLVYSNKVPVSQLFDWLLRDGPRYLQCHPSILQALIHRSIDLGMKPATLRDVRTMGEILEPGLRALCLHEWGVPVRDNYSSEEFGTLAITCPDYDHLHVQSERVIVEILDDHNRPCAPGEIGRVVVTGLLNFAMPLIRHELGDRAVAGAPCPCGRGLPVIERIIGRERHPVTLPSGDRVFPVLDAEPLLLGSGVRQYQLVQQSLDEIVLYLVAEKRLSEDEEARITRHLQSNFGHPFDITVHYVDSIARGPGGKFQIFKSDLP